MRKFKVLASIDRVVEKVLQKSIPALLNMSMSYFRCSFLKLRNTINIIWRKFFSFSLGNICSELVFFWPCLSTYSSLESICTMYINLNIPHSNVHCNPNNSKPKFEPLLIFFLKTSWTCFLFLIKCVPIIVDALGNELIEGYKVLRPSLRRIKKRSANSSEIQFKSQLE